MANETKLGVAPNVGGLICYVPCGVGLVFSIVAVIVEKDNRFVRFHAIQSLVLHGVLTVFLIGVSLFVTIVSAIVPFFGLLMLPVWLLLSVVTLGACVFMMMKANNNEEYRLPVIGDMASQWANQ